MSRRRSAGFERFPTYAPKKPPPEHGIKLKKLGVTWWGQRWIEALEQVLGGDSGRLARGRTYARGGRTHDFVVKAGHVKAKVTGSRPKPYTIELALTELSNEKWATAIAGMAKKAQFSAELLGGEMPKQIDEVFRAAGGSLFPKERADLKTSCTCPDWGDPCKHVAAVHYVLGEALDRDPFLLFELRGRTKQQVLAELRSQRGDAPRTDDVVAGVTLGIVSQADYERAPRALPALSFSFDAPAKPGALLRQLGAPGGWQSAASPVEALAPIVQRAAARARQLALSDATEPTPPAPVAASRARKRPATGKSRKP
jgi:uncharacterized Zn finger protein